MRVFGFANKKTTPGAVFMRCDAATFETTPGLGDDLNFIAHFSRTSKIIAR